MTREWEGRAYLLGAFSLAGTSVVSAKAVSGKLGVFTIAALSLSAALLFLIPLRTRALIGALRRMTARECAAAFLQALFGIFLFRAFLLLGLEKTSAAEAGILTGATPAFTALFARAFLKERCGGRATGGILFTIVGVALLQGRAGMRDGFASAHGLGNLLVLLAAASESSFNTLARAEARNASVKGRAADPVAQTALVCLFALALCAVPALFEHPVARASTLPARGWFALLWYGAAVTALAFILWYAGIARCGALTAAAFSGMMPLTSVLMSAWVLKEAIAPPQWLGGIMVTFGMAFIGTGGRKRCSPSQIIRTP